MNNALNLMFFAYSGGFAAGFLAGVLAVKHLWKS
jgi:hypothetical protein